MIRYVVAPKVYPSGWWVTSASADGFTKLNNTILNPYLVRGFGDHFMLVFFLHLSYVQRVLVSFERTVTFENLADEGHVDPWNMQPLLSGLRRKKAGLTRCNSLVTVEKLSFILSLCYYFSVSITCHGNG